MKKVRNNLVRSEFVQRLKYKKNIYIYFQIPNTFMDINRFIKWYWNQHLQRSKQLAANFFFQNSGLLNKMGPQKSNEQNQVFVDFMEAHPDLAKGFSKGDKVKQEELWNLLSSQLNACGPPTRDVASWKKTWCDWRRSIKSRLAENKRFLNKTGGGSFQQHYLSPIEEQIATICNIYQTVDGIPNAKCFGLKTGKEATTSQSHDVSVIQESYTELIPDISIYTNPSPNQEASGHMSPTVPTADTSPEQSPQPKRKKYKGDVADIMEEERKNFKILAAKMDLLNDAMKTNATCLKNINRNLNDIRSLKKKELEATKQHYLAMEKIGLSKNEMKMEFLKLERMKMAMLE